MNSYNLMLSDFAPLTIRGKPFKRLKKKSKNLTLLYYSFNKNALNNSHLVIFKFYHEIGLEDYFR